MLLKTKISVEKNWGNIIIIKEKQNQIMRNNLKNLKIVLASLVCIVSVSCDTTLIDPPKAKHESELPRTVSIVERDTSFVGSDEPLLGSWKLCGVKSETSQTSYNVCTIIDFRQDRTGRIVPPSNQSYNFSWERQDTILSIITEKNDVHSLGNYKTFIIGGLGSEKMSLTPQGKHFYYRVSKQ